MKEFRARDRRLSEDYETRPRVALFLRGITLELVVVDCECRFTASLGMCGLLKMDDWFFAVQDWLGHAAIAYFVGVELEAAVWSVQRGLGQRQDLL